MSSYVETPCRTFEAGGALAQYLRVKLTSGKLAAAGASDTAIGQIETQAFAAGTFHAVRLPLANGTCKMVAAGAVTQYANVYGAAGGKVDDAPGGQFIGVSLSTAAADNEVIEVLRLAGTGVSAVESVSPHIVDFTLTAADSGTTHTSVGATGTIVANMPEATIGLNYFFYVGAAQQLRIEPLGTNTISLPSTGVPGAAGKYLVADASGETVNLICTVAGNWAVAGFTGTWTAEA